MSLPGLGRNSPSSRRRRHEASQRPGLDEVTDLARKRKIDAVLVWKLDRFARSTSHLLRALEDLNEYGVGFISYDDPGMDTTTPQGKLLFTIMGAVAEMERSQTIERVKAGMARARAEGIHVGRPALDLDLLADMRQRRERGESVRSIADQLGVSVGAVAKYTAANTRRRAR